jgi:hypothetical protein
LCAEEAEEEGGGERWLSCMNALECWKEHFGARWRSVPAVDRATIFEKSKIKYRR